MCNHPKARILYDETKLLEGLPHLSEAWDAESEKIVPYLHPVRGFKRTLDFHVQRKDLTPTNVVATTTAAGSASGAVAGRAATAPGRQAHNVVARREERQQGKHKRQYDTRRHTAVFHAGDCVLVDAYEGKGKDNKAPTSLPWAI